MELTELTHLLPLIILIVILTSIIGELFEMVVGRYRRPKFEVAMMYLEGDHYIFLRLPSTNVTLYDTNKLRDVDILARIYQSGWYLAAVAMDSTYYFHRQR